MHSANGKTQLSLISNGWKPHALGCQVVVDGGTREREWSGMVTCAVKQCVVNLYAYEHLAGTWRGENLTAGSDYAVMASDSIVDLTG